MNYEFNGVEFDDECDLNEALVAAFWQTFGDTFGDDEPALREAFNNWTDGLCKGGDLSDDAYNDCDLVYDVCDARRRRWLS